MPRPHLSRLLLPLIVSGAIAIILIAASGGTSAAAREHRAGQNEVTFRNRAATPINCSLPTFKNGDDFQVEAHSDYWLNVNDLAGVQLVDKATCAGQTVSAVECSLKGGHPT